MPSTAGYMLTSLLVAAIVFCALWWMLSASGDETPLALAALASGLVLLVAAAAREVVMRRAWRRYALEMEASDDYSSSRRMKSHAPNVGSQAGRARSTAGVQASASALRALHQRLAEAEAAGAEHPAAHLEAYRLCEQYLAKTDEAMRSNKTANDVRLALRAGQERVRELQKHHLLSWARGETRRLTQEARRRVRMSDKIETAQRAVEVIEEALKLYPAEQELHESGAALRDFIASVRIGHWVELAERAAFRGLYGRAIARYRDALFFVSRAEMTEGARSDAAGRISREIELLRARLATGERPVKRPMRAEDSFKSGSATPIGDDPEARFVPHGEAIPASAPFIPTEAVESSFIPAEAVEVTAGDDGTSSREAGAPNGDGKETGTPKGEGGEV